MTMTRSTEILECPQCGAASKPSDRKCLYCKSEFFISSLAYLGSFPPQGIAKYLKHYKQLISQNADDLEGTLGLGLCYLQMGTYDLAQKYFERVIALSPDLSQAYYYAALGIIRGRRLMTLSLNEVRRIESYLNTAILLDSDRPHYKVLLAMLKRDYYQTNGMRVSPPNASELLLEAAECSVDRYEAVKLSETVKVADLEFYFRNLNVS